MPPIHLIVQVFVVGVICWLLVWLIDYCGIPQPFNKVIKAIIMLFAVLYLINILMTMAGGPPLINGWN